MIILRIGLRITFDKSGSTNGHKFKVFLLGNSSISVANYEEVKFFDFF